MSVYEEFVRQGLKGDCAVVALKNIYKHFGVEINFTNRETVAKGYFPKAGVRNVKDFLYNFGVIVKEIDLSTLNKNNIGKILRNGLKEGKIYAVNSFDKSSVKGGHVHLIKSHDHQETYWNFQDFRVYGKGFTLSSMTYARDMFLAVNRRNNVLFEGYDDERHSSVYEWECANYLQFVDDKTILADLGIFLYEDLSIFESLEVDRYKKGILFEISGVKERFKKRKITPYKFNALLRDILKREPLTMRAELNLYKALHVATDGAIKVSLDAIIKTQPSLLIEYPIFDEYIHYLSSDKVPCVIEGSGLPMIIERRVS